MKTFLKTVFVLALLAAPCALAADAPPADAPKTAQAKAPDSKQPPKPRAAKAETRSTGAKRDADIAMVQDYLNNLKSARARFVQTTHDGTQLVGTFYLQRPGKLRFEYDPPIEDFVVADGVFIYFYDAELKEQTNAPIGQTLADFFLRDKLSIDGDLAVQEIVRKGGILQVPLAQANDPTAGTLTLGFTEDPLTLKKWRIVDGQGLITEVELFYLKTDITHPSSLFAYHDPNPKPLNR